MAERKYVEVGGKKYPLKTDSERASSAAPANASNGNVRSGNISIPSVPQTSDASRQVLLALSVAFLVFLAAGGKVEKVIAKARGLPEPQSVSFNATTIFAWGGLFVGLMILADTPAGELSKALAWLILLTVMLEFGPQAIDNIMSLSGAPSASEPSAKTPPPEYRGGFQERA